MVRTSFLAAPLLIALTVPIATQAQDIPTEYQQVLSTLGKQGDFKDKVNIVRRQYPIRLNGGIVGGRATRDAARGPDPRCDPIRRVLASRPPTRDTRTAPPVGRPGASESALSTV